MTRQSSKRATISKAIVKQVLVASRRRCCLCYFLNNRKTEQKGQIAHVNHDPSNSVFSNLVYLCLNHHDDFDSRNRQSKVYTSGEVTEYRNLLYKKLGTTDTPTPIPEVSCRLYKSSKFARELKRVIEHAKGRMDFLYKPWKLIWQIEENPELFAYKSPNYCDGICRIERINLLDDRVVVICEEIDGNPGMSVTNAIEYIAFQICEQFNINPKQLVLIEHYDTWYCNEDEWNLVIFKKMPPESNFQGPEWKPMTNEDWRSLGFRPRQRGSKRRKQPTSLIRRYQQAKR